MKMLILTSGDLLADRRAAYAEMLMEAGDTPAAADLMREALALAPGWYGGWFRLGEMREAAGNASEAAEAFREALRLDPRDQLGAALKLEAAGLLAPGSSLAGGFAETLFNHYAETFDAALVERLGYRAPDHLAGAIAATGPTGFAHAIDLGCGTGLMGERLRGMASHLEGIDISAGMLARARAKGLYDRLSRQDLRTFALEGTARADLVTAADVLNYLGRLEPVVDIVAGLLVPGGLFAFSVEAHEGPEDLILRPSRRYAHRAGHVLSVLRERGFEIASLDTAPLRIDRGEPVAGHFVVARHARPERPVAPPRPTAAAADEPAPRHACRAPPGLRPPLG